jgi:putative transposase
MMARPPRITIPAFPHHIIQRGNNRQAVFFNDDDYRFFQDCIRQAKLKCKCRLYAYVLMTNHVLCGAPHKKCYVKFRIM